MKSSKGNAIFIILIAIGLLAALSMAMTKNKGKNFKLDKEEANVYASQIINDASRMKIGFERLRVMGGYDQVLFNDSAANASGTCYSGGTTTTPCNTIGLFNDNTGIEGPLWREEFRDSSMVDAETWLVFSIQTKINGVDVGTSAPDTVLIAYRLLEDVCSSINQKLRDDSSIAAYSTGTMDGFGRGYYYAHKDGTFTDAAQPAGPGYDLPYFGCSEGVTDVFHAFFLIDQN